MKRVVCFSGGESSAITAIAVCEKFGVKDVILLNHDVSYEDSDVKRFKKEVANYLGIPITYANYKGMTADIPSQFGVCYENNVAIYRNGHIACTSLLKTQPFEKFLTSNFPQEDCTIYYGFDKKESSRITRRISHLAAIGYKSDYPLAFWNIEKRSIIDYGITPPNSYLQFKHANCVGCLKAGMLHWYVVYHTRPDVYKEAVEFEEYFSITLLQVTFNKVLRYEKLPYFVPFFEKIKCMGFPVTENQSIQKFGAMLQKIGIEERMGRPCECLV